MQTQINNPITAHPRQIGDHPLYQKTREIFLLAEQLNLAGVKPKVKAKSIMAQHRLSVQGARQMIQLAKPKKHRRRAG
jgi:hypothetical protein